MNRYANIIFLNDLIIFSWIYFVFVSNESHGREFVGSNWFQWWSSNGKPIIRNKRISVETILEFLSAGETHEEILHQFPSLEEEDILACLQFAVKLIKQNISIKNVA